MAIDRRLESVPVGDRRYIATKGSLQTELDRGNDAGWNLVTVFYAENEGCVVAVWENPNAGR